jgi:hypothetical protein
VIERQKRSLETGERLLSEHRQLRADGVYRWFQICGEPVRNAEGEIVQWYVLQTDIHDLKRAEHLLAGEKRLLEMVALGRPLYEILESLSGLSSRQRRNANAPSSITPEERKVRQGLPKPWRTYTRPL